LQARANVRLAGGAWLLAFATMTRIGMTSIAKNRRVGLDSVPAAAVLPERIPAPPRAARRENPGFPDFWSPNTFI